MELEYILISHLLNEGYANTLEAAEVIMENMSDKWIYDVFSEEQKSLPTSRMSRQARRKAFKLGSDINNPSDEYGDALRHSAPASRDNKLSKQLRTMARVGGNKVKSHIKKGFEMGSYYDPQEAKSKYYWLQKLK